MNGSQAFVAEGHFKPSEAEFLIRFNPRRAGFRLIILLLMGALVHGDAAGTVASSILHCAPAPSISGSK